MRPPPPRLAHDEPLVTPSAGGWHSFFFPPSCPPVPYVPPVSSGRPRLAWNLPVCVFFFTVQKYYHPIVEPGKPMPKPKVEKDSGVIGAFTDCIQHISHPL